MKHDEKVVHDPGFLFLEKNKGQIKLIGDVHANLGILENSMEGLKEGDWLIILGDLVDKGLENIGVIDFIKKNNADPKKPKIYAVRGNHEEECLGTIRYLEHQTLSHAQKSAPRSAKKYNPQEYFKEAMERDPQYYHDAYQRFNHVMPAKPSTAAPWNVYYPYTDHLLETHNCHQKPASGGVWLTELFQAEFQSGDLFIQNGRVQYKPESQVGFIKDYFESLPYIIDIEETAVIIHADLLLTDEQLQKIKTGKLHLSKFELSSLFRHGFWWREQDGDNIVRKPWSRLVCAGHSIALANGFSYIRYLTNTFDADDGTFFNNVTLRYDLKAKKVEVIRGNADYVKPNMDYVFLKKTPPNTLTGTFAECEEFLKEMVQKINEHFKLQHCFEFLKWQPPKTPEDLNNAILKVVSESKNELGEAQTYIHTLNTLVCLPGFLTDQIKEEMAIYLIEQAAREKHILGNRRIDTDSPKNVSVVDSKKMLSALGMLIGNIGKRQKDWTITDTEIAITIDKTTYSLTEHISYYYTSAGTVSSSKLTSIKLNASNGIVYDDRPRERRMAISFNPVESEAASSQSSAATNTETVTVNSNTTDSVSSDFVPTITTMGNDDDDSDLELPDDLFPQSDLSITDKRQNILLNSAFQPEKQKQDKQEIKNFGTKQSKTTQNSSDTSHKKKDASTDVFKTKRNIKQKSQVTLADQDSQKHTRKQSWFNFS